MTQYHALVEILEKYYPLGIEPHDPKYLEHPGSNLFFELCNTKMNSEEAKRWKNFVKATKNKYPEILKTESDALLLSPSFGASFILFRKAMNGITYERRMKAHISVLSNHYTIYGLDSISVNSDEEVVFQPVIYISPS